MTTLGPHAGSVIWPWVVVVLAAALAGTLLLVAGCSGKFGSQRGLDPATHARIFGDGADHPLMRASALVARLTLDEKVGQLQNAAPAVPRLGIPAYDWWNESLHGVARNGVATVFPQAIALGATFDEDLVRRVADAIGEEARAKFDAANGRHLGSGQYQGLTFFAPNVNLFRDPRWGRGQETYGEDPFLTARLGVAYVRGLQGGGAARKGRRQGEDQPNLRAAAVAKHFAVHSGPELTRHGFDARVDARDLVESYLPQFQAIVRETDVAGIMAAYNRVNGVPCVANNRLLDQVLRNEWGFDGFVVGDCGAVQDLVGGHRFAENARQGAALALRAGTDLDCGRGFRHLSGAVRGGLLTEGEIDRAVIRLFTVRFRLGLFDAQRERPKTDGPGSTRAVIGSAAHLALAREAARKSLVLLANDGVLPLRAGVRRIAVVGPVADDVEVLVGNYHGDPVAAVTLLAGIRAAAAARGVTVDHAAGVSLTGSSRRGLAAAVARARQADVIVAALGLSPRLEGEEGDPDSENAAGDRRDLRLPGAQSDLLAALLGLGKPTVVVLTGGSAIALPDAGARGGPGAVLMAWYPGEQGGHAVADVLFGAAAPSGRLPITFYRSVEDLPPFTDYRMMGRTYRYFAGKPLYRFGHGLGYARIVYSGLRAKVIAPGATSASVPASDPDPRAGVNDAGSPDAAVDALAGDPHHQDRPGIVSINLDLLLENQGDVTVEEVVQIYATARPRVPGDPLRSLIAFRRVSLQPGEKRPVEFALPLQAFSRVDAQGNRRPASGTWQLTAGDVTVTLELPPVE